MDRAISVNYTHTDWMLLPPRPVTRAALLELPPRPPRKEYWRAYPRFPVNCLIRRGDEYRRDDTTYSLDLSCFRSLVQYPLYILDVKLLVEFLQHFVSLL